MKEILTLLLMVFLALASFGGYLFLNVSIIEGERQISDGQRQIAEGRLELMEGKARLEAGKLEASDGKKEYEEAEENLVWVLADRLLQGGSDFKEGRDRIAAGDRRIAEGVNKINDGERQLAAGQRSLLLGRGQLGIAKGARIACVLGACFFSFAALILGFCWRRTLARTFLHSDGYEDVKGVSK